MEKTEKLTAIKTWLGTGTINIFGRPFAGKDTQGRILQELFGGALLGGGEILRGGAMPDPVKSAIHTGKLIPSEEYMRIVLPYLMQDKFKDTPLILSSVGRWSGEEIGVIEATKASNHPTKAVIYLDLSEDGVRERWALVQHNADRGFRHDDTKEILEIRLEEYRIKTLPVIEFYRNLGILISVDANASREDISDAIIDALYDASKN